MAVRDAVDNDFNKDSRQILSKIEVFFDGISSTPVTITNDDYLMSIDILDEAGADSASPLGAVAANEINITLLNTNARFSPLNTEGPYYNKIVTGVKIIPYFKIIDAVDDINWIQMGVYYVSSWLAKNGSIIANVTARDILQNVFKEPTPNYPLCMNRPLNVFFAEVFSAMGYAINVSPSLSTILPYAFVQNNPAQFLQEMMVAAMAVCNCNRFGAIEIYPLTGVKPLRATITDADQIMDIETNQTIIKSYDGVEINYNLPQLTERITLLDVKQLDIPLGMYQHTAIAFAKAPVKSIDTVEIKTPNKNVTLYSYSATPNNIKLLTQNTSSNAKSDVIIKGIAVDLVTAVLTDNRNKMLTVTNKYIQTRSYATTVKTFLNRFVTNTTPTLELQIRGNPLYKVGDKIRVQSNRYNVDYTGVIQRLNYIYDGGLRCEMTLLNSEIVEVI